MSKRTYYYHDLINDDFAATQIDTIHLPDNYRYVDRRLSFRIAETAIRWIVYPLIYLVLKIGYIQRFRNRKSLEKVKGQSYFLFANHTDYLLDAFSPSILSFPRKVHIIANPDAVSIKGLGTVVKLLGAIPIPTTLNGMKSYLQGIEKLIELKRVITIYPEAHIWPYYTDIRPFGTESFHYAANTNSPCFAVTNIYQQRKLKLIKRPKVLTFIDGPFYPDMNLQRKERTQKLRDDIYNSMKARVDGNPKYNYCNYVYVEDESQSSSKKKK